jgi:hypothetical protein
MSQASFVGVSVGALCAEKPQIFIAKIIVFQCVLTYANVNIQILLIKLNA